MKAELERIKSEKIEPKDETLTVPLVENKYKQHTQFKVNIPKKFAEALELDKSHFEVLFKLQKNKDSDEKKLTAEIARIKNE